MPRGRKILLGLICIVVGVYSCVRITFPITAINYRLTVEAVTPDGPKQASGVIQISIGSQFNMNGGGRRGDIDVTGEAIYLDLGRGKNLFVTLTNNGSGRPSRSMVLDGAYNAIWLPIRVFQFKWDWGNERELERQARAAKVAGPKDVPLIALPTLVTFRDLTDPMSVELIDPRDISAAFGSSYALTKAILELTDDPPTVGIERTLNWVNRINGGYLHGGSTSRGSPYGLSGLAFKSEGFSP